MKHYTLVLNLLLLTSYTQLKTPTSVSPKCKILPSELKCCLNINTVSHVVQSFRITNKYFHLLGQFRGKFEDRRRLVDTQLCLTRVDHFQGSLHCVLKKRSTTSDLMRRLFRSPRHVFTTKLQINLEKTCILQNFLLLI